MENGEINIEKIMDDIRAEIKEKGYTSDILSFEDVTSISLDGENDFSKEKLSELVSYMNSSYAVPITRPLGGNPIVVFIKRVIRKLTRFIIRPIVEHQSEYNSVSARAVGMIGARVESVSSETENRIALLELKLQTAMKEIERLNGEIERLQK